MLTRQELLEHDRMIAEQDRINEPAAFWAGDARPLPADRLLIVGIKGPARSGKGTIAKYLAAMHGFHPQGTSLGDPLRAGFNDLDGPTWEMRKELAAAGLVDRSAIQLLGTECREDVGAALGSPDVARLLWIAVLGAKIRYASKFHPAPQLRFVVPDVRYPAEPEGLGRIARAWGGHYETWEVWRPGADGRVAGVAGHSSEKHYGEIPAVERLGNTGTIRDLCGRVDEALVRTASRIRGDA